MKLGNIFTLHLMQLLKILSHYLVQNLSLGIFTDINREVIRLKIKKTTLWRKYCRTHCTLDYDRFARVRNDLCSLTQNLKSNYQKT